MSKYQSAIHGRDAHILTLRGVIALLVVVILYIGHGWSKSPENLTIDIPPDLRSGISQPADHKHPANVYAFGLYVWQQLNNWPSIGETDYPQRIDTLRCYLTPDFKQTLEVDFSKKAENSELSRQRHLLEIPGRHFNEKRIYIENDQSWVGFYDINLVETYNNEIIKDIFAQYSLRIVRYNQNPSCNPFGLAIDGFYKRPVRLEGFKQESSNVASTGE